MIYNCKQVLILGIFFNFNTRNCGNVELLLPKLSFLLLLYYINIKIFYFLDAQGSCDLCSHYILIFKLSILEHVVFYSKCMHWRTFVWFICVRRWNFSLRCIDYLHYTGHFYKYLKYDAYQGNKFIYLFITLCIWIVMSIHVFESFQHYFIV